MVAADFLNALESFDESGILLPAKTRQNFGKNGLIKKPWHDTGILISLFGTIVGESQNFTCHAVAEMTPDGLQLLLKPDKELLYSLISVFSGLTIEILL